jgi:serine/threonine-protein kinase
MLEREPSGGKARVVGRYALFQEIAAGGMATLHLGRLIGSVGFSRTVAIKRLHPQFAKDPEFVAMFLDEALLAGRVRHPNVVGTIDVVALDGELLLVMDYVHGESLSRLLKGEAEAGRCMPLRVVSAVMTGALHGLHAAHEATTETGFPLGIVHRDVSPQNILVGQDGIARVLDFGVAKAAWRAQTTRDGQIKGKLAYMSPEQLLNRDVDRRADIFAASAVIWEALTGTRLFSAEEPGAIYHRVLNERMVPPSELRPDTPPALEALVMKGLSRDREDRFATAREMAFALERAVAPATPGEVGIWVEEAAHETLQERAKQVGGIESSTAHLTGPGLAQPPAAAVDALVGSNDAIAAVAVVAPTPALEAGGSHKEAVASSIATASDVMPSVGRGRRHLAIVLAAAIACLAAAAVLAFVRGSHSSSSSSTPAPASASALTSGRPADNAEAPRSPTPPAPEADAGAVPAASSLPVLAHRPVAAPAAQSRPPRPVTPPARPHANCTPPYSIDSAGFRVLKPECL